MVKRLLIALGLTTTIFTSIYLSLNALKPGSVPTSETSPCRLIKADTLLLEGMIADPMLNCVQAKLHPAVTTVIVNSSGGEVGPGREIGYLIGRAERQLIIREQCLSSCANYFVPAAASVLLEPQSVIGLHGTPDPMFHDFSELEALVAKLRQTNSSSLAGAERSLALKKARRAKELAAEQAFSERFSVPPGWRHYREVGDHAYAWLRHFQDSTQDGVTPDNFMIVEEDMIRSCLPEVEINAYQDTLDTSVFADPDIWSKLKSDIGAYRSRGLMCRPYGATASSSDKL